MKRSLFFILVVLSTLFVSGCAADIKDLIKMQSANCSTHFSGSLGGGMLGTQTGVVSFTMDCLPTGVAPATSTPVAPTTGPAGQATKSPL